MTNLATAYARLGRIEDASRLQRDVYYGRLKLDGEEDERTLRAANNYASSLSMLRRFKEAKSLTRKTIPVARRVLGENHERTLALRWIYANTLSMNESATVADLREAVTTLKSVEMSYKRVFGASHPETQKVQNVLNSAQATLAARAQA